MRTRKGEEKNFWIVVLYAMAIGEGPLLQVLLTWGIEDQSEEMGMAHAMMSFTFATIFVILTVHWRYFPLAFLLLIVCITFSVWRFRCSRRKRENAVSVWLRRQGGDSVIRW